MQEGKRNHRSPNPFYARSVRPRCELCRYVGHRLNARGSADRICTKFPPAPVSGRPLIRASKRCFEYGGLCRRCLHLDTPEGLDNHGHFCAIQSLRRVEPGEVTECVGFRPQIERNVSEAMKKCARSSLRHGRHLPFLDAAINHAERAVTVRFGAVDGLRTELESAFRKHGLRDTIGSTVLHRMAVDAAEIVERKLNEVEPVLFEGLLAEL